MSQTPFGHQSHLPPFAGRRDTAGSVGDTRTLRGSFRKRVASRLGRATGPTTMTARMTTFDWLVAQVGMRRSERRWSRSLLLNPSELPGGGWSIRSERSWRAGVSFAGARPHTDEGNRARRARCVVAWRAFEDSTAERWLWVEAVPLVSEVDAASYVSTGLDQFVPDPRARKPSTSRRLRAST